mgnify:FL=1|jgi:hypothetical protein
MNILLKRKIDEIKEKIKDEVELKQIIKLHFGGSRPRLEKWLTSYLSFFSQEELDYLNFTIIPESVTDEEIKAIKEVAEVNEVEEIQEIQEITIPTMNQISLMSRKDRENFLLSNQVIEKLIELLTNNNNVKLANNDIVIPDEVRNLEDLKIQNIRISSQIYQEFTSICKKKGLTITSVINAMFLDFIKKHS